MRYSKEFYMNKLQYFTLDELKRDYAMLCLAEEQLGQGIINETLIRSMNHDKILQLCLCEGKYNLFKILISPFAYQDGDVTRYRYFIDAFSRGILSFINYETYDSFSEAILREQENDKATGARVRTEDEILEQVVVIPSNVKKEILTILFSLDSEVILSMKIRDVLARQVSGMGNPIYDKNDVIFYSESSTVYANIELFNKNIVTTSNDTLGCYDDNVESTKDAEVDISIDYSSLDEYNKFVADSLVKNGFAVYQEKSFASNGKGLFIIIKCNVQDTLYDVNERLLRIVSQFHKQDMLFGMMSLDEVVEYIKENRIYLSSLELEVCDRVLNSNYTERDLASLLPMIPGDVYYDDEEKKFWFHKSYVVRHKNYLKEQKSEGIVLS